MGFKSLERITAMGSELRRTSKIANRTLQQVTGVPSMMNGRALWMNRWDRFVTQALKKESVRESMF